MAKTVTLVLTHTPYDEYVYNNATGTITDDVEGRDADWFAATFAPNAARIRAGGHPIIISGLWGTMGVFIGPKVHWVMWPGDDYLGDHVPDPGPRLKHGSGAHGQLELRVDMAHAQKRAIQRIWFNNRILELETDPGALTLAKSYTTAERYRGNGGGVGGALGFIMLRQRIEPYDLRVAGPYQALIDMRRTHNGEYVRILGGQSPQERAILIHEAAHPGWVTGCIAPRPLGNRGVFETHRADNPAAVATHELIQTLRTEGVGRGQLFVIR